MVVKADIVKKHQNVYSNRDFVTVPKTLYLYFGL